MELFRRKDSLDIDTRAAPTPPYEQPHSAVFSLLLLEQSTVLRGADTTGIDSISVSTPASSNIPATTTSNDQVASALVQAGRSSAVTSTTISCIILGVVVIVIFMLLALMFFIKRSNRGKREAGTPIHGLEMRAVTERARFDRS